MRKDYGTDLEALKDAVIEASKDINRGPYDSRYYWPKVYINVFNDYPHYICSRNEGLYNNIPPDDEFGYKHLRILKDLNLEKSFYNLIRAYEGNAVIFRDDNYAVIITNDFMIYRNTYDWTMTILDSVDYIRPEIKKHLVEGNGRENTFFYVTHNAMGFQTTEMPIKKTEISLEKYYNDNLPHQQIVDFLGSDKSGLVMLHGEPGGGKTSYIRYLISQFPKNKFLVMDSSVFNYITDSSFIQFLIDYENHVVILEDCENMITETRDNNIASLLNMTDGLLGDGFKMKFICTFNTDTKNIDNALLRKGRLKVKYEFNKLCKEKVEQLNAEKNLGLTTITEMTLAELFNCNEDNGGKMREKRAVGF